jgi:hypothetical protein
MNIQHLQEPVLEFGAGRHVDIRFGLMNYGPLDFDSQLAPKQIKLGIVGTPETVEGLEAWFQQCQNGIAAKPSNKPNLFPHFPGFTESFRSSLLFDRQLARTIRQDIFEQFTKKTKGDALVNEAAEMFLAEFRYLAENASPDVLVCALPMCLLEALDFGGDGEGDVNDAEASLRSKLNFHHLLKARAMALRKPVQIVLPTTYDKGAKRKQKLRPKNPKQLQDEATRAWNLHTALYYKAGGIPWRLVRDATQLTVCFVGVSFYKSLDLSTVMTSVAQVFNQLGEGVVVRGGAAHLSKEDRQPHLSSQDAKNLLNNALSRYRDVHRTFPARIVLHKTSTFNRDELEGFRASISASRNSGRKPRTIAPNHLPMGARAWTNRAKRLKGLRPIQRLRMPGRPKLTSRS